MKNKCLLVLLFALGCCHVQAQKNKKDPLPEALIQLNQKVDSESVKTLIFSPSTIIKSKIQNLLISPDKINCFPLTCDNDFAFSPHKKFISRVFLTTSEEFGFSEIILNEKESNIYLKRIKP